MSKFFNETLKARNSNPPEQRFNLAGLEEIVPADEQTDLKTDEQIDLRAGKQADLKAVEPDRVYPKLNESRRIEIPESMLLPAQFEGSDSLQSAEEAYRALRTRLLRLCSERALRSVIVTSSVPGEGKTLTSFNFALTCSQLYDMRVLLIDGDIRTGGLTRSLGVSSSPGLADVLSGRCDPESVVLETNYPALSVCSSGSTALSPAELYAGNRWQEFMAWCHESFKLVLVDAPPIISLSDVELMTAACDGVLMVVRASHTRRDVLQKSANQIDPKKLLGIVYNVSEGPHHKYYYAGTKDK
jgi:capsular exopolysaccharide synthesis family protein